MLVPVMTVSVGMVTAAIMISAEFETTRTEMSMTAAAKKIGSTFFQQENRHHDDRNEEENTDSQYRKDGGHRSWPLSKWYFFLRIREKKVSP